MGVTDIELRLKRVSQLFNDLDPSPLVERDLADAVAAFIVDGATDAVAGSSFRLVIHTSEAALQEVSPQTLADAIGNYFSYCAKLERSRNSRLLRQGRSALAAGTLFLLTCTLASQGITTALPGAVGSAIGEGLIILGWVANWRPIEIFLYDWRPARQRAAVYEALSAMEVVLIPANSAPHAG